MPALFLFNRLRTRRNFLFWLFIISIELFTLFKIIIPFLRHNNLYIWDMIGHYFSAWYTKEYLFPRITGWNPFFFLGFPQNQFYPPLYSYLSTALSYLFGLELAFKLVLAMAVILTPISFYYFARKFSLDKLKSSLVMLIMWSILFIVPANEHLGGNFHSTFNVGLVTNALALPLLFFFLGKLNESFKTRKYLGPSILFALLILTHVFTAIVGTIAFAAFALVKVRKKEDFLLSGRQALLTFLLTSFWTIPFIAKSAYARPVQIGHGFNPFLGIFFIFSLVYLIYTIKKQNNLMPMAAFLILLLLFLFIGDRYLHLPLHFYRFQLFFYLFIPIIAIGLFREEERLFYVLISLVAIYLVFSNLNSLHPAGVVDMMMPSSIDKVTSRVLVIASPTTQPSPHIYQHLVPELSGNYGIKGLFVESSPNAKYVFDLEKELDRYSLVWGVRSEITPETNQINPIEKIHRQFDIFDINYVFSFYQADDSWKEIKRVAFYNKFQNGRFERHIYKLYRVGDSKLIEVLTEKPKVVKEDWEEESAKWFLSGDNKLPVLVNSEVPDYVGMGNETVEILKMNRTQEYIKFKVNSDKIVPILIKISEFPNWQAHVNGEPTKIYRASPHLMLIYGKGEIELKYKSLLVDYLGIILSLAGLCWLGKLCYDKI